MRSRRPTLEPLEDRRVLSSIVWTNEGPNDQFQQIYCADPTMLCQNAIDARALVHRAMDMWEQVIPNLKVDDNTLSVTVTAQSLPGLRGQSNVTSEQDGRPTEGWILMDDDAGGAGWFFDPTPEDSIEFSNIVDADTANSTGGDDFLRTMLHELGHVLGFNGWDSLLIDDNLSPLGPDPMNSSAQLSLYQSPGSTFPLMVFTDAGGLHVFEGPGPTPNKSQDLMNSGRATPFGTRRLISDTDAFLLKEAYGYATVPPSSLPNFSFHVQHNVTSGTLTVNGELGENASVVDDYITLKQMGDSVAVTVLGTLVDDMLFPISEVTGIVVNPSLIQDGDDTVVVDLTTGDWLPAGGVTVIGGAGTNTLKVLGPDTGDYSVTEAAVTVNGSAAINYANISDLVVEGGSGADVFDVNVAANVLNKVEVWGFAGDDRLNVDDLSTARIVYRGGDDNDQVYFGPNTHRLTQFGGASIYGGPGTDQFFLNDTENLSSTNYFFNIETGGTRGVVDRNGSQFFFYETLESIDLDTTPFDDSILFHTTLPKTPVTVRTYGGDDGFTLGAVDKVVDNIRSRVTIFGGDDDNTLWVDDSNDSDTNVVTITDSTIGPPIQGGFQFFAPGGSLSYADIDSITVDMGSGSDVVRVESTPSGVPLAIDAAGGDDTVLIVGPPPAGTPTPPNQTPGITDDIGGLVTVQGGSGVNQLRIIDASSANGKVATITETTVGQGWGDTLFSRGGSVEYANIETLTVELGSGEDHVTVESTYEETETYLRLGDGADEVLVSSLTGTVNQVQNLLSVDGQVGNDVVVLDDSADPSATKVTITETNVGAALTDDYFEVAGRLDYFNLTELHVSGGMGSVQATIHSTKGETTWTTATDTFVYGGPATDTFTVPVGSVGLVRSALTIDGRGGDDIVAVDDHLDATENQVTITSTSVGDAPSDVFFGDGGTLYYDGTSVIGVATGVARDRVIISSTDPATRVFVNSGDGNDVFVVDSNGDAAGGATGQIESQLELHSGNGFDFLATEDISGIVGRTVSIRPTGPNNGTIGDDAGDDYFGVGGRIAYTGFDAISVSTSNAGADTINVAPSPSAAGAWIAVNGNGPDAFADVDLVQLDLTGVVDPSLSVLGPAYGRLVSASHGLLVYQGVEYTAEMSGTRFDLSLETAAAGLPGNDGLADRIEASVVDFGGKPTLSLQVNDQPVFLGSESAVNSMFVRGSSDPDTFIVRETSAGFPAFPGNAPFSHLNGSYTPANVGIHYDAEAGAGPDSLKIASIAPHDVMRVDDMVGPGNSGNVNVAGEFTLSYVNLTPIALEGAGGSLLVDATRLNDVTRMILLETGGGKYELTGDGSFEDTTFSGYDSFDVLPPAGVALITGLVVNSTGDGVDLQPGDGICQTSVNSTECTLRAAIEEANAGPFNSIEFNIPGTGPHRIQPRTALPAITQPVTVDGYTEPGASPNTLPIGLGSDAVIMIEVNGGLITDGSSGLVFESASSTVRGLSVTGFGYPDVGDPGSPSDVPVGGIVLLGNGNEVEGNFIGVAPDGTTAAANNFYGIYVRSSDNMIGGSSRSARNIVSGNQGFGVIVTGRGIPTSRNFIPADRNRMHGNLIGTERTGSAALPNTGAGIVVRRFSQNNEIGGNHTPNNEVRNVISGNGGPLAPWGDPQGPYQGWPEVPFPLSGGHGAGIHVENLTLSLLDYPVPNSIQGNLVGTTADGNGPLGNRQHGIGLTFTNNVSIGGSDAYPPECSGVCNVISAHAGHGIAISRANAVTVQGNRIGTDTTGQFALGNQLDGVDISRSTTSLIGGSTPDLGNLIANNRTGIVVRSDEAVGNTVRLNSIHSNRLLGIDLVGTVGHDSDGPTPNDSGDTDTGPNNLQNYPVITTAQFGPQTFVEGTFDSTPATDFVLDFYASPIADASGYGEGQRWLGSTLVTTDEQGNASYSLPLPGSSVSGEVITATATRLELGGNATDSSEYSAAFTLHVGVGLRGCTLEIHATEGDDTVNVRESDHVYRVATSYLRVAKTLRFDASQVDAVEVMTRGGDDQVRVAKFYPPDPFAPEACQSRTMVRLETGDGNDAVRMTLDNAGPSVMDANIDINGGRGHDVIDMFAKYAFEAQREPPKFLVDLTGNEGDDQIQFALTGAADANGVVPSMSLSGNVALGSGNDLLRTRLMDIALSDSTFDVFGDDGLDRVDVTSRNVTFDGFAQKVHGGPDADDLTVSWRNVVVPNGVKAVSADLSIGGQTGDDTMTVTSRRTTGDGAVRWQVDGHEGDDTIDVRRIAESLGGNASLAIAGQAGDDQLTYSARSRNIQGHDGILMSGGDGNDELVATSRHEHLTETTWGMDGGAGDDYLSTKVFRMRTDLDFGGSIDAGGGDDTVEATFNRGVYNDYSLGVLGGDGQDKIAMFDWSTLYHNYTIDADGGDGDDAMSIERHNGDDVLTSVVQATGGFGNDTIDVHVENVDSGNVTVNINGGPDTDVIDYVIDGWTFETGQLFILSGLGDDVIDVRLTGVKISGGLTLLVDAGADDDLANIEVDFHPSSTGTFHGQLIGDTGNDDLTFRLMAPLSVTLVLALLDGGDDFDTCVSDPEVTVINCEG